MRRKESKERMGSKAIIKQLVWHSGPIALRVGRELCRETDGFGFIIRRTNQRRKHFHSVVSDVSSGCKDAAEVLRPEWRQMRRIIQGVGL